jgi:hypothetical protein
VLEGAAPEVTCAPSAQGMQALPMVLVVLSPILECDPGPEAFIAVIRAEDAVTCGVMALRFPIPVLMSFVDS